MLKKFRVAYSIISGGFVLSTESFWIDPKDYFEEDMDEFDIKLTLHEATQEHFNSKTYPDIIYMDSLAYEIKEYLQGENNELA